MRATIVLVLAATPAFAEMQVDNTRYACDRGVEVPVVYVNDPEAEGQSIAILQVEGSQILLYAEPAASGVRYGWPSDGSNYVWLTKGDSATLPWKNGETREETVLLAGCVRQ